MKVIVAAALDLAFAKKNALFLEGEGTDCYRIRGKFTVSLNLSSPLDQSNYWRRPNFTALKSFAAICRGKEYDL